MTRLIVAGQAWDDGSNAFVGGRVVRLETDGSWAEVFNSAKTGCHHLKEFTIGGNPYLFFIESAGNAEVPRRGTLQRSADEGDTWTDVSPTPVSDPEFVKSFSLGADGRIWAITDERENPGQTTAGGPSRIYYSDDKGDTWTLSHTIPQVFSGRFWQAYSIAANPNDENLVVVEGVEMVGFDMRIWRTTDGGASWSGAINPTFPVGVDNVGGNFAKQLDYASDDTLVYITRAATASSTLYIFRSSDNGSTWSTWHSEGTFSGNDGNFFLEGCTSALWFLSEQRAWRADDFADTPPAEIADDQTSPFVASQSFEGLDCISGLLILAVFESSPDAACCGPAGVWQRPLDLSTGWVEHPEWNDMDGDLGYRVYPWPWGVVGATPVPPDPRFALPCEDVSAVGDFNPQCIPVLNWEISVDGQHSYFSRARAQGMGISNAGQDTAALLPNEGVWAPAGTRFGNEGGTYNVRREIVVNDYGINQAAELDNLASAYLPLPDKTFKGITTIKFQVGGIPRAGSQAPAPNKIIQAGDKITFACGSDQGCGIAEGDWVVDEVSYEFPRGITTILASKRPAAHARPLVSGNIRNLGESLAAVGGVYESPWFSISDDAFLVDPSRADPTAFYDTFAFNHFMGVPPRTITMVAAKTKIFDWYDEDIVTAAQPLYVPRQFIDLSQVQGVGYNILEWDKNRITFHFLRYLFYDDIDGAWIRPQDRFIKVWLMP